LLGTFQQQPLQALAILMGEQRLSSGAAGFLQCRFAVGPILLHPARHSLTDHFQSASHLRLVQTLIQKANSLKASRFQRVKIASNSGGITHTRLDAVSPEK
jgi:hypothetical protein